MPRTNDHVLYQLRLSEYDRPSTRKGSPMHERQRMQRTRPVVTPDTLISSVSAGKWTTAQVRGLVARLLDATGIDYDQRVEVLGGALVSEAVRPHWESGLTAEEAHERLCRNDAELAEVVEAVSAVLLARVEAQDEARAMIGFVEAQLLNSSPSYKS